MSVTCYVIMVNDEITIQHNTTQQVGALWQKITGFRVKQNRPMLRYCAKWRSAHRQGRLERLDHVILRNIGLIDTAAKLVRHAGKLVMKVNKVN